MAEHEVVQPTQAPPTPVVAPGPAAPAPLVGLGMGPPASFGQWDPAARARYTGALQAGYGNQHVARMATLARAGPVEVGAGALEIPTDVAQEYAVDAEVEEMCARRGARRALGRRGRGPARAVRGRALRRRRGRCRQGGARAALQTVARAVSNIAKSGPPWSASSAPT